MRIDIKDDRAFDLRGLRCPVLGRRVRKILARAPPGEILEVLCSDPLSTIDVPHLVARLNDEIVGQRGEEGSTRFLIRKKLASGEFRA